MFFVAHYADTVRASFGDYCQNAKGVHDTIGRSPASYSRQSSYSELDTKPPLNLPPPFQQSCPYVVRLLPNNIIQEKISTPNQNTSSETQHYEVDGYKERQLNPSDLPKLDVIPECQEKVKRAIQQCQLKLNPNPIWVKM